MDKPTPTPEATQPTALTDLTTGPEGSDRSGQVAKSTKSDHPKKVRIPAVAAQSTLVAHVSKSIALSEVHEDPHNARQTYDSAALKALADSIDSEGLLQPIVVRPIEGGFRIVAGHRRYRAHQLLGRKEIPCIVREDLGERGAIIAQLAENLAREDLTPYEEALAFQRALDQGVDKKQLCAMAGVAFNTLALRLRILELPESVARRVGRDGLTMGHAQVLAKLAAHPPALKFAAEWLEETTKRAAKDPQAPAVPTGPQFEDMLPNELHAARIGTTSNRLDGRITLHPLWKEKQSEIPQAKLAGTFGNSITYLDGKAVAALVSEVQLAINAEEKEARKTEKAGKEGKPDAAARKRQELAEQMAQDRAADKKRREREAAEAAGIATLMAPAFKDGLAEISEPQALWCAVYANMQGYVEDGSITNAAQAAGMTREQFTKLTGNWHRDMHAPKAWTELKPLQRARALAALSMPADASGCNDVDLTLLTGKDRKGWRDAWVKAGKPQPKPADTAAVAVAKGKQAQLVGLEKAQAKLAQAKGKTAKRGK